MKKIITFVFLALITIGIASAQGGVPLEPNRCTPLASTWRDGTSINVVAVNIIPPSNSDTIWHYQPALDRHIGWSRIAPQGLSDLKTVNFLDVLYVCVDHPAQLNRPGTKG